MPKYQCQKCGALYAGWAGSKICLKCGGKLKSISFTKYYEEQRKQNKISKYRGRSGHDKKIYSNLPGCC